jgi:WD40 repeat protein
VRFLLTSAASGSFFLLLAAVVWWLVPLRPRATLPQGSEILRLSPDGRFLATRRGGRVTLWDVATGRAAGELPDDLAAWPVWEFTFSADGRWLAASGDGLFRLWEVPAGREWAVVPIKKDARADPAFSPDGKWLAFRVAGPDHTQEVKVWDLTQRRERVSLPGPIVREIRFSPDGKTLAFESAELRPGPPVGRIRLWDAETGEENSLFGNDPAPLRLLAFSPDGRTLAVGERQRFQWGGEHEITLWDRATGKGGAPWKLPRGVHGLRFSADGSRLLVRTSADDPAGGFWNLTLIDPTAVPPGGMAGPIPFAVSHSPDGRLLACATNAPGEPVTVLELPAGRTRAALKPRHPEERLFPREFTQDGGLLAVVAAPPSPGLGGEGLLEMMGLKTAPPPPPPLRATALYVYETGTGRAQGSLPVVASTEALFTPDGRTLVVLAPGRIPTLWDLPLQKPWGRVVAWWALLGVCFAGAGLWRRGRRKRARPAASSPAISATVTK